MSHVEISKKADGGYSVKVDGHEMATSLSGLSITICTVHTLDLCDRAAQPRFLDAEVTLTIRASVLAADLPAAVLDSIREEA